jgi:hypothetical protein
LFLKEAIARRVKVVLYITAALYGLVALYTLYNRYDRSADYALVEAHITQVGIVCFYRPTPKNSRYHDLGALTCDAARHYSSADPGSTVDKYYTVMCDYISPADRAPHSQRLSVPAATRPEGLKIGDVLGVLASKTEPYGIQL